MKNRPFPQRFKYAWAGIRSAWRSETSFRTQCFFAAALIVLLTMLQPAPVWWAMLLITSGAVLACELMNTALEHVVDRLHPDVHPMIALAKDCAAGAVLVLSFTSLAVFACFLASYWRKI